MFFKLLTVSAISSFEIYAAIATGIALGLNSRTILICTLIGGVVGVFVAAFLGQKIKEFTQKYFRKNKTPKPKTGLIYKIWEKYGAIGLGSLGTLFFGAPIAIGVGVGFGVSPKKIVPLCLIMVVVRCFAFTFLGDYLKGLFD